MPHFLMPYAERHEVRQQHIDPGPASLRYPVTFSEDRLNVRPSEHVFPHAAPDPIRQGDTPARPAAMPVVVTTDPTTFGYWTNDDFSTVKHVAEPGGVAGKWQYQDRLAWTPRGMAAATGARPNITRPPAIAYGSLFDLSPQTYGYS